MTDIDFDELDKAVNSALKPALEARDTVEQIAKETPAAEAVPATDSVAAAPAVIIKPRNSAPLIGARDRQESSPSPAIKRSGRFMDMVHPSSDMAADKKSAPAPKVKIMPTENAPKPEEINEPKHEPTEKPAQDIEPTVPDDLKPEQTPPPAESTEQVEETPEELVKSDYPDPLDVAGPLSTAEENVKKEAPAVENRPEQTSPEVPFIPDAKVEKRPLGGFVPDEPVVDESEPQLETDESQLPPEAGLPAALQSDVVAVESDALPDMLPGQVDEEFNNSDKHDKPAKPAETAKPEAVAVNEGAAQSIPQQYHSAPSTANEDPRPVFDTDQYHQPLIPAHSGKKSHVWAFVLLILALLAVGGTLGYFAFMSGL